MRGWAAPRIAAASGATLLAAGDAAAGPSAVAIDSRAIEGGELFVGLRGERTDGGQHAAAALRAGAWGALIAPAHADDAAAAAAEVGAVLLSHPDPLAALQGLAAAWRAELVADGARVIAITGSTGKTSTKDILAALLSTQVPTWATPANLNTEIGLPLAILAAPAGVRCLVLEMAMRGPGQIAELTAIADPDVGVILNVGPAHLELLGSLEAIAAAKAELIAGLAPGRTAVLPAREPLLAPHVRSDLHTVTFGEDGEVTLQEVLPDGRVRIRRGAETVELAPSFEEAHNLRNLLAAVAAAGAVGVTPHGELRVVFSAGRGGRLELAGGVVLIDDCYNANPMSMAAALEDLARRAPARSVAVLGDMLELGPSGGELHRQLGVRAGASGVDLLIAVGPLAALTADTFAGESHRVGDAAAAAELLPALLHDGDTVLVKASRGVGLEVVVERLCADTEADTAGPTAGVAVAEQDARADEAAALVPGAPRGRR